MKIYAAGWALQTPALNFFKKFLRLNGITISGIIYPKKVPEHLDDIPVLDFAEARKILSPEDLILDCHRPGVEDRKLRMAFSEFFESLAMEVNSVTGYLQSLIKIDHNCDLKLPVAGVTSQDIRNLWSEQPPEYIQDQFADLISCRIATTLDDIARNADWDRMLSFDQDETADSTLFEVLKELYDYGFCQSFFVVDTPRIFLNALLKLKTVYPEAELSIKIHPAAIQAPEHHFEFYQRCLNLVIDENGGDAFFLSGSTDAIASRIRETAQPINALFFMQRSILDFHQIKSASGNSPYRLILRQADTAPTNLICALIN